MKFLTAVCRAIDKVSGFFGAIAAWLCLLLVLLTCEQVVARYIFQASSVAAQELEWHLFGAVFLLAGPYALRTDAHVRVDIFYTRLSPRRQAVVNVLGVVLMLLPACYVFARYGFEFTRQAMEYPNLRPLDYYSASMAAEGSRLYEFCATIEGWLRRTALVGERSPDPGGLEGRWLVRSLIPLAAVLMALQGVAMLIRNAALLAGREIPGSEPATIEDREGL